MRSWIDAALSILLAPQCASCGEPLARPTHGAVCDACWQSIVPVPPPCCDCCGDVLLILSPRPGDRCLRCLQHPPLIERTRAIGLYEGTLRTLVHALKYAGRRSLARPLAALMRERQRELLDLADVAVPVPLHRARRRQRGFNQAEDLARGLGLPVVNGLRRSRHTATQAELSAADRIRNVAGAFDPAPEAAALVGRSVVLVDDVMTTGATLNACADVLRRGGAERVVALTAARAVTRWP